MEEEEKGVLRERERLAAILQKSFKKLSKYHQKLLCDSGSKEDGGTVSSLFSSQLNAPRTSLSEEQRERLVSCIDALVGQEKVGVVGEEEVVGEAAGLAGRSSQKSSIITSRPHSFNERQARTLKSLTVLRSRARDHPGNHHPYTERLLPFPIRVSRSRVPLTQCKELEDCSLYLFEHLQ